MLIEIVIVHPSLAEHIPALRLVYPNAMIRANVAAVQAVYESVDRFTQYDDGDLHWAIPAKLVRLIRRDPCVMILRHEYDPLAIGNWRTMKLWEN